MKAKALAIAAILTTFCLALIAHAERQANSSAEQGMGTEQNLTSGLRPNNAQADLQRLLQSRLDHPERTAEIDAQILDTFGQTHAVFIFDLSGFSRATTESGIIETLSQIHQMQGLAGPAIAAQGGTVLKLEADNVYALFPAVDSAVAAASDLLQQLQVVGLRGSVGIGYGDVLVVAEGDAFGAEMNLASKLGEDIAAADEILLTEAAFQEISSRADWTQQTISTSGLNLRFYQAQFEQFVPEP